MAIGSFIGGFAKRGSQDIEDIKKSNRELIDFSIQTWVQEGLSQIKSRTEKRRETDKLVDALESHFTPEQVGVLLKQGDAQRVLTHVQELSDAGQAIKPDEIVSVSGDFSETGLTYADVIDRYMGNVRNGSDSTTALMEATGGASGNYMKKRVKAFESAFGMSINELMGSALQDIEYGNLPTGTINTLNPVAKAQADEIISSPKKTLTTTTEGDFFETATLAVGGTSLITPDGRRISDFDTPKLRYLAKQEADRAGIRYENLRKIIDPETGKKYTHGKAKKITNDEIYDYFRKNHTEATPQFIRDGNQPPATTGGGASGGGASTQTQQALTSSGSSATQGLPYQVFNNDTTKDAVMERVKNNLMSLKKGPDRTMFLTLANGRLQSLGLSKKEIEGLLAQYYRMANRK
jgi:hypothetical protein